MKKNTLLEKTREISLNKRAVLDYSLIVTEGRKHDLFGGSVFSVLVLLIENGITVDYEFVYDISRDEEKAVAILETLVYNNVMPGNVSDVVADIL